MFPSWTDRTVGKKYYDPVVHPASQVNQAIAPPNGGPLVQEAVSHIFNNFFTLK